MICGASVAIKIETKKTISLCLRPALQRFFVTAAYTHALLLVALRRVRFARTSGFQLCIFKDTTSAQTTNMNGDGI